LLSKDLRLQYHPTDDVVSVLFLRVDSVIAIRKRLSFEADQRFNVGCYRQEVCVYKTSSGGESGRIEQCGVVRRSKSTVR